MANNTYVWSYLLFALLVFLMVLQQVVVEDKNPANEENVKIPENLATEAEKSNSLRDTLQKIYRAEVGVRELKGNNDGKRVEEYLAVTKLGKGYAWCAAFISWTFAQAGFEEPNTPWSPALFPIERVIWERGRDKLSA